MTAIACEDDSLLESRPVSRNYVFRGSAFEDEAPVEFMLSPGEKYGWWADHDLDNQDAVALVHGAINNYRTHIILDSGASTTILGPDLARRLKLKLASHAGLKVKGMGGVITYIRSRTRVKLTLGMRVVYVLDMWVGNIGDGVACLLGMDFMKAAGVRLCAREQLVKLPNEEDIPLVGEQEAPRYILEVPICVREPVYLAPGDSIIVPVRYGQADADTAEVWTARGNQWVTQVIYSSRRRPAAVRVVNISEKWAQIMQHTVVAALVEPGQLPRGDRFVQPKSRKYREWQQEIYQHTPSREYRRREELEALKAELNAPPAVLRPQYVWPTKILQRPPEETREAVEGQKSRNSNDQSTSISGPAVEEASSDSTAAVNVKILDLDVPEVTDTTLFDEAESQQADELDFEEDPSKGVDLEDTNHGVAGGGTSGDEARCELNNVFCAEAVKVCEDTLEQLDAAYAICLRVVAADLDPDEEVFFHEGTELLTQLRDQLAVLPDLKDLSPKVNMDEADVGVEGKTTPEMNKQMRSILEYHHSIFLGDGNAVPAPARGVVCDLDVGDSKPIAQRARPIAPRFLHQVCELIKKLLETGLIETSHSEWASPIVIILKKNGKDIRLCIDYRMVNQLIKLSCYPLPLIDDLLIGFEAAMWFMSLDMASGFWAVPMTQRAKLISAFVCPLGHYQWLRMPFGLKNAPLIYQQMLNNCLWGFVRLSPDEEAKVDPDVLEFLGIEVDERAVPESGVEIPTLTDTMTVFHRNIPAPATMGPVLGRSSYIDDIAHGAPTWDQLCSDLNALLFRLRYWGISVSLPKSEFGKLSIPYLSHEINAEGLRAKPKIAKGVADLPFPSTLKGVQSFLGSINYYNKFIEDLPVIASVLYELTEEQVREGRDLGRAKEAFEILKKKIVSTPLLRHPDREKDFVVILHANPWAASAVLGQEYDGVIFPVRYTGKTLNESEVKYHPAEKEVVALLRVLRVFHSMLAGSHIKVYTRYSVLRWIFTSSSLEGRCQRWATLLSPWDLEIHRIEKDEDGLAAIMGAGITPREHLDKVAESLIPKKGRVTPAPPISLEMLEVDYSGYLLSFDGAAKTSTRQGSCGCILWKLPEWCVVSARGYFLEDVTVNDAEYHGLIKGTTLAMEHGVYDLVVVGDSRIAIQQAQGLINCHQPNLQRLLSEFDSVRQKFQSVRLIHVKREFNQAADYLTSRTMAAGESLVIDDPLELSHLRLVNRIPEKLVKQPESGMVDPLIEGVAECRVSRAVVDEFPDCDNAPLSLGARVLAALTRSQGQAGVRETEETKSNTPGMTPLEFQAERWRRIKAHQDGDPWMRQLKTFLRGDLSELSELEAQKMAKIADNYVLDSRDVLYYLSRSTASRPRDARDEPRLVVPHDMRQDLLHHCHEELQGGHQGITRTHERLRREFFWPGLYADVERFVKEGVDCASGKGKPPNPGPSPGNIEPNAPFEVLSMDFVTHLPKSERGNTFLLLFQDMFSGFVMCKPMSSTTAQDVAEAYEEAVFRRFGASSMLRHDQDPRFMSEVFSRFREMLGTKQRATLAYRPQANGQQERSVQTMVRSIRAYVAEADQSDWDDHAEKLVFALNTSFDSTRLETPFYLVHGWDAKSTVSAMLGPPPTGLEQKSAYEWRRKLQRDYSFVHAWARDLQKQAKRLRSEAQTQRWQELSERLKAGFQVGDSVWLYLARVQPGLTKKFAHMWHGPFRIEEVCEDFRVRLKIEGTGYRIGPWVHISRLKPRALFPERPMVEVEVTEGDDFDAALLPEDSWDPEEESGVYEVEAIKDVRWTKRTRTSRRVREYLVKWKGYTDLEWLPVTQLSCGNLLYEFNKGAKARARFRAMQAGDDSDAVTDSQ